MSNHRSARIRLASLVALAALVAVLLALLTQPASGSAAEHAVGGTQPPPASFGARLGLVMVGERPELSVSPTSGGFGTVFTIQATGFRGGESVDQWLASPDGNRLSYDSIVPNSRGEYRVSLRVFQGSQGRWTYHARGDGSGLEVTAAVQISL